MTSSSLANNELMASIEHMRVAALRDEVRFHVRMIAVGLVTGVAGWALVRAGISPALVAWEYLGLITSAAFCGHLAGLLFSRRVGLGLGLLALVPWFGLVVIAGVVVRARQSLRSRQDALQILDAQTHAPGKLLPQATLCEDRPAQR